MEWNGYISSDIDREDAFVRSQRGGNASTGETARTSSGEEEVLEQVDLSPTKKCTIKTEAVTYRGKKKLCVSG